MDPKCYKDNLSIKSVNMNIERKFIRYEEGNCYILIKILNNGVMYIHDFKCSNIKTGFGKMLLKKVIKHLHDKKFITFVIGIAQSPKYMKEGDNMKEGNNNKLISYYKKLGFIHFDEDNSLGFKEHNFIYNFSNLLLETIYTGI